VWKCTYERPRTGDLITVKQLSKPTTKTRKFKVAGGLRNYKLIRLTSQTKEVIIVARAAKKKQNTKDLEDDDLEELEALEELDDLEDEEDEDDEDVDSDEEDDEDEDEEDEDEDEDDEEEDDEDDEEEDEEPAPKKSKKKTPAKSRAREDGRVGSQEVAEHFNTDARTLRMVLRKHKIAKNPDSGRYDWSSLNHPEVKKIGRLIKGGAAKEAKAEGLERVKKTAKKKRSA